MQLSKTSTWPRACSLDASFAKTQSLGEIGYLFFRVQSVANPSWLPH
jgi:hypothetical protein